jgi:hypothetical protein
MPSKNPRLSVVLSPAVAATLAAISKETGDSASSLVRGLLDQTAPALERMLELVRAAKAAKGQIGEGVRGSMDRVVNDLQDALALANDRTGRVVADLVSQAETVKARRRRSGLAAAERSPAGAAPPHGWTAKEEADFQAYQAVILARERAAKAASTPVSVTRGSGTGKTRRKG